MRSDRAWLAGTALALCVAVGAPVAVFAALGQLADADGKRFAAVLTLAGAFLAATTAIIGSMIRRQSERRLESEHADEQARLSLDAAMRAGALLNPVEQGPADPAAVASGLLALTQLGRADLAVALMVDLWDPRATTRLSNEIAILILDEALQCDDQNVQLIAAELLCRNSEQLDPVKSLDWPACVNGVWRHGFGVKTKLLLIDAMLLMTLHAPATENALQSIAVRLYGVWGGDEDPRVRACVATMIQAIVDGLEDSARLRETPLDYEQLMQGSQRIFVQDLVKAGEDSDPNPNGLLDSIVMNRRDRLRSWVCKSVGVRVLVPGQLAPCVCPDQVAIGSRLTDAQSV